MCRPGDPPPAGPPWPLLPRSRRRAGFQARSSRACNPCPKEADMTVQSTQTRAAADAAATAADQEPGHGAEIVVPLNRLKASPKNARKVKHTEAGIEALAASIKVKGVLQPPVVEIERGEDGAATGAYLVTIGEGRRRAAFVEGRDDRVREGAQGSSDEVAACGPPQPWPARAIGKCAVRLGRCRPSDRPSTGLGARGAGLRPPQSRPRIATAARERANWLCTRPTADLSKGSYE